MNIEKTIMAAMALFTVWSGIYLKLSANPLPVYETRTIKSETEIKPEFDIDSVIDNTPFDSYFSGAKRNPFIPVIAAAGPGKGGGPTKVNSGNPNFKFPKVELPKPDKPAVKTTPPVKQPDKPKIPVLQLPAKPNLTPEKPAEKVDPEMVKKDETIPVYLIGFAKTYTEADTNRKALLANKKSGQVYTVKQGDKLLGMTVSKITPYSIIIVMKNGRKVEFLKDVLKEAN